MDKLASVDGKWLFMHEDVEVRELMLELSAQGLPDHEIAEVVRASGKVERITVEDVKAYKRNYMQDITTYADRNARKLLGKMPLTKRAYRVGQLDRLLQLFADQIPVLLETKPAAAATLMSTYLKGQQQIAVDVGDLQAAADPKNRFIEMLQRATPEQRVEIMKHLNELEMLDRELGGKPRLEAVVVDAEFEVDS